MQVGLFMFLKQVGLFIRLERSLISQKSFKNSTSILQLKSPRSIKLSKSLQNLFSKNDSCLRCVPIRLLWGLYEPFISHFLFLMLISTVIDSISSEYRIALEGMSSRIYKSRPPPCLLRSSLYGTL